MTYKEIQQKIDDNNLKVKSLSVKLDEAISKNDSVKELEILEMGIKLFEETIKLVIKRKQLEN